MAFTNYRAGSASTSSASQDETILSRPRGVYTGEYSSKRSSDTRGYNRKLHQRQLERAIQAILKSEGTAKEVKAPTPSSSLLQDWTPKAPSSGYSSSSMEKLSMEFAQLAAELQHGWTE